ncbi:alpha/beta hydrolase-fold protein [Leifsonia sp. NPDC080035]|uniref:Alpha/beta hydrolase-fold protein n=1 Tax=Leifsonia sp. NPDC080035 TaxID=3143936 RepID=A0AAU7GEL8_9MICO
MTAPRWAAIPSAALGEELRFLLRAPRGPGPHPVTLLLHGRGDGAESWEPVFDALPDGVVVIPDAPWLDRAGYWVDSAHPDGRAVETAVVRDLLGWVDAELPVVHDRGARTVARYSMGGAGAVRLGLAHPALFGTVIALSPAIYEPDPPPGSSARESGAFGTATARYDPSEYTRLGHRAALEAHPGTPTRLLVATGDAEPAHPGAPAALAVGAQARELVRLAGDTPGIEATFREFPGGHGWETWRPALRWALSAARDS